MKKFIKVFANLKFAIFLLLLIALFSSFGSIIEQDKSLEFYQTTYTAVFFNIPLWNYFINLGLNHIYSCFWFYFLILIFTICIISCTFSQQLPALKFAQRYYFYTHPSQFNKLRFQFSKKIIYKSQLCYVLTHQKYSICQKQTGFYGYKGLIGRIGPVIVHLSIICILTGSILGAIKGFSAQEFIPKSEIFHIQNLIKIGNFAKIPQQTFRINDFWVEFEKTGLIKQFQSDISILSGQGNEIIRKTISVNNPFVLKDLTLYQTDWGIIGLRLKLSNHNSVLQLPVSKIKNISQKLWVSWVPLNILTSDKGIFLILNSPQGKIDFYNENAKLIKKINIGQTLNFRNLDIHPIELILATGIQIKSDPGIKIIYSGFASLMVSSLISYISFSEIWFLELPEKIFFGGQTSRAKNQLKIELSKVEKLLITQSLIDS
jgi:cytochrome c biogenesis protein